MRTFCAAVSAVNGGSGGRLICMLLADNQGATAPRRRMAAGRPVAHPPLFFTRDAPDGSRTDVNIGAFRASRQDSRGVPTATRTSDNPNGGRAANLAIFRGIWTRSSRRLLFNARPMLRRSRWRWWRLRLSNFLPDR